MVPVIPFVWALVKMRLKKYLLPITIVLTIAAAIVGLKVAHEGWVQDVRDEVREATINDMKKADDDRATQIRRRVDAVRPVPAPERVQQRGADTRGFRD